MTGFSGSSVVKNPLAKQGMWVPFLVGKIPWRRNGNPLQYSCLGIPMDRGAWWATVPGVAKDLDMTERINNRN